MNKSMMTPLPCGTPKKQMPGMITSRIDPATVRAHFPALDPSRRGSLPPVFFDNPAGTQIAAESLARMND
jgi:selenocysteine lyase/cysteine desulfurase